ncbi:patatin-like phospholipase family protein [Candidatus Tisiphia endosymbiont of Thecophora atra]|uniref:patatin-like phospholipase family protein n=1 Tax=Candidatus Tisiphia endosymbiont of Thecophora atra TaxID=3066258 RepID=UPI00312C862A
MTTNQTGQNKALCLSGGGVKGIAELVVLAKIEEITQQPISKLFNIISGTSVGGLIAALLTIPKEEGSTEPRYSAKEALELFENTAPEIFPQSWFNWGIIKHKYSQEPLKKMLEKHLGDNRLDDSLCRLIIPVADLNEGKNSMKIFDSHDQHSPHVRIKDVLLATTAAPTYFKAVVNKEAVKDYDYAAGKPYAFADGGLGANRPAATVLQILKEGLSYHEQADIMEHTMICSINFGKSEQTKAQIPSPNFDGALGWLLNGLIDTLMKNDEEADVNEVRLDLTGEGQNTEIWLPIPKECKNLDDSSQNNIAKLKVVAEQYLENNSKLVQDLCDRLKADWNDNLEQSEISNALVSSEVNDEGYESNSISEFDITSTNPRVNVMINTEVSDEGYESNANNSNFDIVTTAVEPEVLNAMVSNELESSSTIVTNGETYPTVISEKFTTTLQWIKELYAKDSKCALEYLEYVNNVSPEELDLTKIESLPEEVQKTVQWIVGLDTEGRSELLENIKSLIISTSHDYKDNISCVQEVTKLEGQDTLYEHADDLVDCY